MLNCSEIVSGSGREFVQLAPGTTVVEDDSTMVEVLADSVTDVVEVASSSEGEGSDSS